MNPSILYDHLTHGDHIHWCDVEASGLAACERLAYREHALVWAGDAMSALALTLLTIVALRLLMGAGRLFIAGEITSVLPCRRRGTQLPQQVEAVQ